MAAGVNVVGAKFAVKDETLSAIQNDRDRIGPVKKPRLTSGSEDDSSPNNSITSDREVSLSQLISSRKRIANTPGLSDHRTVGGGGEALPRVASLRHP